MRYPGSMFLLAAALGWMAACSRPADYWSFPSFPARVRPTPLRPASPEPVSPKPGRAPLAEASEPPRPWLTQSDIREQALIAPPPLPQPSQPLPPAPLPPEMPPTEKRPAPARAFLEEATIRGKEQPIVPLPKVAEGRRAESGEKAVPETVPAPPEESSLLARTTPDTPPWQVASIRLAEDGRTLLQAGEFDKGLSKLEKAIALDSRNRYAYYFLAEAHYHLTHHQQSLNFLEIVEPLLSDEPLWLARVYALQGENYRALGFFERADTKYIGALALDPSNLVALDGLSYLPPEILAPPR